MKILFENSGGMKEMELVAKLYIGLFELVQFQEALTSLQKENKIAILTYTWYMSEEEDAQREKRFIYTP